jgi:hypothetical protein
MEQINSSDPEISQPIIETFCPDEKVSVKITDYGIGISLVPLH